jgi:hypothetical protein
VIRYGVLVVVGLTLGTACARTHSTASAPTTSARVREALVAHGAEDQAIRDTLVRMLQSGSVPDTSVISRQHRGDARRAFWLSAHVATHGWPKASVVGAEAADAAFLIVQHATHDTTFQARMLVLLTAAARTKEASPQSVALLTDRVMIRRGQPQMYGTQARMREGRIVLDPITDSINVDVRRAQLGLPPLHVYLRTLEELYTPKPTP